MEKKKAHATSLPGLEGVREIDIEKKSIHIDEMYKSAEILFNEGLSEESKRMLRKILREDPHHIGAKKKTERNQ